MIYLRTNTQKQMNKWNTRIYYVMYLSTKKYINQKKIHVCNDKHSM